MATTIVVNNQKGGVGKTTLACHLAWYLAEGGKRTALIDLDIQGNASSTLSEARDAGPARALFDGEPPTLSAELDGLTLFRSDRSISEVDSSLVSEMITRFAEIESQFDYVVIDTPPGWGWLTFAAFAVTDSVIAPTDLKGYAIAGIGELSQSIATVNARGRSADQPIKFLGLLVSRFNSIKPRERAALAELLTQAGDIVFEGVITERTSYAEAVETGEPVWRLKGEGAKVAGQEIRPILEKIKIASEGSAA